MARHGLAWARDPWSSDIAQAAELKWGSWANGEGCGRGPVCLGLLKGFLVHAGPLHVVLGCFQNANYQALLELQSLPSVQLTGNTAAGMLVSALFEPSGFSSERIQFSCWLCYNLLRLAKVKLPNICQACCQGTTASLTSEEYVDSVCSKEFCQHIFLTSCSWGT